MRLDVEGRGLKHATTTVSEDANMSVCSTGQNTCTRSKELNNILGNERTRKEEERKETKKDKENKKEKEERGKRKH